MRDKIARLCGMRYSPLASKLDFRGGGKLAPDDCAFAVSTAWRAIADWMLDFGHEWRKPETGVGDEEEVPVNLVRKLKELNYSLIAAAAKTESFVFLYVLEDAVDKIQMAMCDYDGLAYEDFPDPEECARLLGEKELAFYLKWKGIGEKKVSA